MVKGETRGVISNSYNANLQYKRLLFPIKMNVNSYKNIGRQIFRFKFSLIMFLFFLIPFFHFHFW